MYTACVSVYYVAHTYTSIGCMHIYHGRFVGCLMSPLLVCALDLRILLDLLLPAVQLWLLVCVCVCVCVCVGVEIRIRKLQADTTIAESNKFSCANRAEQP